METSGKHSGYRTSSRRKVLAIVAMALVSVVLVLLCIAFGDTDFSLSEVFQTVFDRESVPRGMASVIWNERIPQALAALFVGAALGIAGAEMQTVLDNPLAEPYTLGVSMSAAFGAALVMAFGIGTSVMGASAIVVSAFLLAMVTCAVIFMVSRSRRSDRVTIILTGVALLFLFQALVNTVQSLSSTEVSNSITFWMFGSLYTNLNQVFVIAVVLALVLLFFAMNSWKLTALRLGDSKVASMGVNVANLRRNAIIAVSVLTAIVVSFTGTIGFIGLVGPHIARRLVGEDQRFFLPASALSGALFLLAAHLVCNLSDLTSALPIGVVTSLVGVPFFLYMIHRGRRLAT